MQSTIRQRRHLEYNFDAWLAVLQYCLFSETVFFGDRTAYQDIVSYFYQKLNFSFLYTLYMHLPVQTIKAIVYR